MRRVGSALLAVVFAACGGGGADTPETAAVALERRLEARDVSVRSISCVTSGFEFEEATAYRCTVNFGDPHLVPYCAALPDGDLVTDRERPEFRCYPPEDEERYRAATVFEGDR